MSSLERTIVLIHGLWNSPEVFDPLLKTLKKSELKILTPNLPHAYGRTDLNDLAIELDRFITSNLKENITIDLLGFSMGAIIGRIWLQKMGGSDRTRRFISVGSPHKGTFLAQLMPHNFFTGIAQMKRGSSFLKELNSDLSAIKNVECISLFSYWDLMVIPGWDAKLPFGLTISVPVFSHKSLIKSPVAINYLVNSIINVEVPVQNV